jgi:hypothetical protein
VLLVTVDRLVEIPRRFYGVREVRGSPAAINFLVEAELTGNGGRGEIRRRGRVGRG